MSEWQCPTPCGTNGKRVFNKNTVQEVKSSPVYRSLKKQSIVVYLRCTTKEQEKTLRCKVKQYCKLNNFKAIVAVRSVETKDKMKETN